MLLDVASTSQLRFWISFGHLQQGKIALQHVENGCYLTSCIVFCFRSCEYRGLITAKQAFCYKYYSYGFWTVLCLAASA